MTSALVRIPSPLRAYTDGRDEVEVSGETVGALLQDLCERHAGLRTRILDEAGEVRRFVNVFVGSTDVRSREGLGTPVAQGEVLSIVPAVAGGAR